MVEEVLIRVKNQFTKDYNCKIEDFNSKSNLVTDKKLIEGRRIYGSEDEVLKILIFGKKAIISADECIKEWCVGNLVEIPAEWMFSYSILKRIDTKAFDSNYSDVLAIAELDEEGNIRGMAGSSEDSNTMWQIGVNVLSESKGRGIAKSIVTTLKNEILRRGKVPFYGTIESRIISQKVEIQSGFYPAFAELKTRKMLIR